MEKPLEIPQPDYIEQEKPSKIERGLREFRIYRVAPNDSLLTWNKQSMQGTFLDQLRAKSLFFTTQKNMALAYNNFSEEKPALLLEQRGIDFLEDLQKLESQGVQIVLLSHDDLEFFHDAIHTSKFAEKQEQEVENFIANRTYDPSRLSLRGLRKAAEIIVVMPDNLKYLPLTHTKKTKIKPLDSKKRGEDIFDPSEFHEKIARVDRKKDRVLGRLRREKRRLERERSELFGKSLKAPDNRSLKAEIDRLSGEIAELQLKMADRRARIGYYD